MKNADIPEVDGGHRKRLDCIVGRCPECRLIIAVLRLPARPEEIRRFGGELAARSYEVTHATSAEVRQGWGHAEGCSHNPVAPATQRDLLTKGGE